MKNAVHAGGDCQHHLGAGGRQVASEQSAAEAAGGVINTITLLADVKGWEKEKLVQLKSEAQDCIRYNNNNNNKSFICLHTHV